MDIVEAKFATAMSEAFSGVGRQPTANQRKRYLEVIRTTLELLRTNGFEGTKIQDISTQSGVALATIYRYFTSRDKLIYLVTQEWLFQIMEQALPKDVNQNIDSRLITLVRTTAYELIQEPRLLEAWVKANLTTDSEVIRSIRNRLVDGHRIFPQEIRETELASNILLVMESVWFAGIVRWAFGQKDYDQVHEEMERAMLMALSMYQATPKNYPRVIGN